MKMEIHVEVSLKNTYEMNLEYIEIEIMTFLFISSDVKEPKIGRHLWTVPNSSMWAFKAEKGSESIYTPTIKYSDKLRFMY